MSARSRKSAGRMESSSFKQGTHSTGKTGEMAQKIPCQGKNREICQNTGKTQGILFAQVENSLILQVKDTVIFAAKI